MNIKVIDVRKINHEKLKAHVDVAIDALIVKKFLVVEKENKLKALPPRGLGRDGKWYDAVIFLNEADKTKVMKSILKAYKKGA